MSESDGNIPSKDPANEGTLAGAFSAIFQKLLQGTDGMLPAKVISYDRPSNTATVQPIIAMISTDGERVPRANIAKVPVLALGGGGFVINFPLKAGDLGWIEASDRDISLFMQSLGDSQPNTYRMHSFEDGRFIPDAMRGFNVSDASGMVVQSTDGTVRMELTTDTIKMRAPHFIGNFTDVDITGATTFRSAVDFKALTTHEADAKINGITFSTHKHAGVQPGSGTSGGPTS